MKLKVELGGYKVATWTKALHLFGGGDKTVCGRAIPSTGVKVLGIGDAKADPDRVCKSCMAMALQRELEAPTLREMGRENVGNPPPLPGESWVYEFEVFSRDEMMH